MLAYEPGTAKIGSVKKYAFGKPGEWAADGEGVNIPEQIRSHGIYYGPPNSLLPIHGVERAKVGMQVVRADAGTRRVRICGATSRRGIDPRTLKRGTRPRTGVCGGDLPGGTDSGKMSGSLRAGRNPSDLRRRASRRVLS
ncbi:MAG: hypothetical protein JSS68_09125 [Actinobacteria bacterium]|nr:hypothetical protein [Actinomycetota bacterium]